VSLDEYFAKLESLGDASLDEVIEIYLEHTKAQQITQGLVGSYIDKLRLEESDEDEVEFVELKLTRFLEAFHFNVLYIEADDLLNFIEAQKGSIAAKKRLEEIVFDFKSFVTANLSASDSAEE
jgi:hypothetical protein